MACPWKNEIARRYRARNRDAIRARAKARYSRNRVKILAALKERYRSDEKFRLEQRARSVENFKKLDRDALKEKNRHYREKNEDKLRDLNKKWRLNNPEYNWKQHGLTLAGFITLAVEQKAKCAICGVAGKLCVDHDHVTGQVRGLLCSKCNVALGLFGDSYAGVERAATYLRRHSLVASN